MYTYIYIYVCMYIKTFNTDVSFNRITYKTEPGSSRMIFMYK